MYAVCTSSIAFESEFAAKICRVVLLPELLESLEVLELEELELLQPAKPNARQTAAMAAMAAIHVFDHLTAFFIFPPVPELLMPLIILEVDNKLLY